MGRDTIESLKDIVARLHLALRSKEYLQAQQVLEELLGSITKDPSLASSDLLITIEKLEIELLREKEEILAQISDLQNLKKYRS